MFPSCRLLTQCAEHEEQPHQQADGCEADVELLVLKAEAASYIHYNLEARARHGGKEVRHHQLQALKGCTDQRLAEVEQETQLLELSFKVFVANDACE